MGPIKSLLSLSTAQAEKKKLRKKWEKTRLVVSCHEQDTNVQLCPKHIIFEPHLYVGKYVITKHKALIAKSLLSTILQTIVIGH